MWLATNSRCDMLYEVAWASQQTAPNKRSLKRLLSSIERVKKTRQDGGLPYKKSDLFAKLRVTFYTDALRHIMVDGTAEIVTQIGFAIFFTFRESEKPIAHLLAAQSKKSSHVTNSIFGAETVTMCEGFQMGHMMREMLETVLGMNVEFELLTDSKYLVETISLESITKEVRMMNHVDSLRECFSIQEISRVGHVDRWDNYANILTKPVKRDIRDAYLGMGYIHRKVQFWTCPIVKRKRETKPTDELKADGC